MNFIISFVHYGCQNGAKCNIYIYLYSIKIFLFDEIYFDLQNVFLFDKI